MVHGGPRWYTREHAGARREHGGKRPTRVPHVLFRHRVPPCSLRVPACSRVFPRVPACSSVFHLVINDIVRRKPGVIVYHRNLEHRVHRVPPCTTVFPAQ
eukprot:scaffold69481_cov75-Phaeocystis_antarctica.AAC.3